MQHPTRSHQGRQGGFFGCQSLEGMAGGGYYDAEAADAQVSWCIFKGILGVVTVLPTVWYHKGPQGTK